MTLLSFYLLNNELSDSKTIPYPSTTKQSIALYVAWQCFVRYEALLYRGIKLCFSAIKPLLFNLQSNELQPE